MVWHSEVYSGESSICVCHLLQKCITKTVNMSGSWPGWLRQYGNCSERVVFEFGLTCE